MSNPLTRCKSLGRVKRFALFAFCAASCGSPVLRAQPTPADNDNLQLVRQLENARTAVIQKVMGSVIAIYGDDREGGGSGVIIDPSGIALTNHHVIQAAGVEGWGGLADGKLYRWTIIGSDPGGDIAMIQMHGRDEFPFARLGNSDLVRIGDWALAMGNPFVLSEDETPTVTMGIVSGTNRFQEGAGSNQLVYGNCIQVDSSINPGNSGGPLFNMSGEVIGINGRGSFEERGRVNVGLGYAISANQIRNFIPELLATKIAEHGALDATFDMRDGRIVCESMVEGSAVEKAGLALGDRLVSFERQPIHSVNQFLNLICTLPESWLTEFEVEKPDGARRTIHVALYGLPYNIDPPPPAPEGKEGDQKPTPEQRRAMDRQKKMAAFMATPAGTIRDPETNVRYANWIVDQWRRDLGGSAPPAPHTAHLIDSIQQGGQAVGQQESWLASDGRFLVAWEEHRQRTRWGFDGSRFWVQTAGAVKDLSLVEAKTTPQIIQALTLVAAHQKNPFAVFGSRSLDGSDKAQHRLACRLKFLDDKNDWFYCWVSLFNSAGQLQVRPLKVSSNLREQTRGASVTFVDWAPFDGIYLPKLRAIVAGIDERPEYEIQLTSCEVKMEIDEAIFQKPDP